MEGFFDQKYTTKYAPQNENIIYVTEFKIIKELILCRIM